MKHLKIYEQFIGKRENDEMNRLIDLMGERDLTPEEKKLLDDLGSGKKLPEEKIKNILSKKGDLILPEDFSKSSSYDDKRPISGEEFVKKYIGCSLEDSEIKIVSGEEIRKWYFERYYASDSGSLGGSQMRYKQAQSYLDIYVNNPDKCNLAILTDEYDRLVGRALIWKNLTYPPEETFMDRIYTTNDKYLKVFLKYAEKNGWIYKYSQSAHDISYIDNGNRKYEYIYVGLIPKKYNKYPYMDTLKFYNPETGKLSSQPEKNNKTIKLDNTDGKYSNT